MLKYTFSYIFPYNFPLTIDCIGFFLDKKRNITPNICNSFLFLIEQIIISGIKQSFKEIVIISFLCASLLNILLIAICLYNYRYLNAL